MGKMAFAAVKWHPLVVLVAYVVLIGSYHRYLDSSLTYIRPPIPAAPEDILGFGFWVPWLIVAVWFAIACLLSFRFASQRRVSYWVPIFCAFSLLSVTDFYLFGVLERQVLAG